MHVVCAGTSFRSGIVRVRLNQAVIGLFQEGEGSSIAMDVYSMDGASNNNYYSVHACVRAN